jgi:hypothetical protein
MWRDPNRASREWLQSVTSPAARLPGHQLLSWWTQGLNRMLTEMTDLGRYRDSRGVFDAGRAFRALRTLDRMFLACARIQAHPDDHVGRVNSAFGFLDLLPSILSTGLGQRSVYENLVNPARAMVLLNRAFERAPLAISDHLHARTDAVTSHLREETLDTVVEGRRVESGVRVGEERDAAVLPDEYVASLFRKLRNTHHGYALDQRWKRDLLDSHTGHIAYGFPELVVLLTVALVADPETVLSGGWFTE